jgi:hypothetical protein
METFNILVAQLKQGGEAQMRMQSGYPTHGFNRLNKHNNLVSKSCRNLLVGYQRRWDQGEKKVF